MWWVAVGGWSDHLEGARFGERCVRQRKGKKLVRPHGDGVAGWAVYHVVEPSPGVGKRVAKDVRARSCRAAISGASVPRRVCRPRSAARAFTHRVLISTAFADACGYTDPVDSGVHLCQCVAGLALGEQPVGRVDMDAISGSLHVRVEYPV